MLFVYTLPDWTVKGFNLRRLMFSLYSFSFFNKFLLLTPVYAIFMQQNGVSDVGLSTMFIISSVATVLGQFPITFLTNRLGQRWAMILGQFLKLMAILLWLFWPCYTGFAAGMVLWGLQAGFRSVAFEGMMYDAIKSYGRAHDYSRILGRKYTYESIGVALSACGSLLMFLGYDWVTWASVAAILMSVWCLIIIPRFEYKSAPVSAPDFRVMFRTGVRVLAKTPCLMSIMLLALLVVNIPFLDDFLSPIGLQLGIATEYVGVVSFFLLACATVGQRLAYRMNRLPDIVLYLLIGVVGLCYLAFATVYNTYGLVLMGLGYMIFYALYNLFYAQFQHLVPTRHRSVILSLYTTLTYLVYIAVCGIVGLGGAIGSWRYSIMILGVMMLMLCGWSILHIYRRCELDASC